MKSALDYVSNIEYDLPYPGVKEMLLITEVDDKEYLTGLFMTMLAELPARKVKK